MLRCRRSRPGGQASSFRTTVPWTSVSRTSQVRADLVAGAVGVRSRPGGKMVVVQLFAGIDSSSGSESVLAESVHPGTSRWREHDERKQMPGDERGAQTHGGRG